MNANAKSRFGQEVVMKRRSFLAAGCLAATTTIVRRIDAAPQPEQKQYLELRHYELASLEKRNVFNTFMSKGMIPALNSLHIAPVGVFRLADNKNFSLRVLLPHNSMESVTTANTKLLLDPNYLRLREELLGDSKNDPAYLRMHSSLLLAFDLFPSVEIPSQKDTRVFQLRIYESYNPPMAKRKIEMFNKGIIHLFRRTGVKPVFMGECLIDQNMPRLSYMVGFDNTEVQKKAWDVFRQHPEWKTMQADPYYSDTVSKITNIELRPTSASQI
ncbi:MAG: NIPSNAP family protein [Sedimentisphaerales bacterium]|nr:NIPSNAP family protein [Sedimentisphaerales bacterium]